MSEDWSRASFIFSLLLAYFTEEIFLNETREGPVCRAPPNKTWRAYEKEIN